jgi:transposase
MAAHKKGARRLGAYLVFLDESGFLLIGTVRRTWAPRGQTPITRYRYQHVKASLISALSVSPKRHRVALYYQLHRANIRRPEVCAFLRHLLRHLPGHVIVLWDNGQIHKGEAVRLLRARHPRLHLEYFPGYAPELNPDEGVWNQTKGALANGRPDNLDELAAHILRELANLRRSPASLRACFHESDLPPFLRQ